MIGEINSKDNKIVKHIIKIIQSSKYRKEANEFFVEGMRLAVDASNSNANITTFLFTKQAEQKYSSAVNVLMQKAQKSYIISNEVALKISETTSPQGIFCLCQMKENVADFTDTSKSYIVLERLQDPSNVGTIFRSAEAFGIGGVFLTADSCDQYSPKVVRGSMGAIFRLPIITMENTNEIIEFLKGKNISCYGAVVGQGEFITKVEDINKGSIAMFIGNEGQGLTDLTTQKCDKLVTIPMTGRAESLNASMASSIIMWEMVRK